MLIGNKADLEQKRQVPFSRGEEYAKQEGLLFFETSALESAASVTQAFTAAAKEVY